MKKFLFYCVLGLTIILLGGLKAYDLLALPFDSEEIFSFHYSQGCSFIELFSRGICYDDGNPPLHFLVLKFFLYLFGASEITARLLSVVFFVFSMVFFVLICWRQARMSQAVTYISVLLYGASSFIHYYSRIARAYSLLVLCSLATFYFFVEYLQQKEKEAQKNLIVGGIAVVAGLFSHYSFIVFLLLLVLSVLLTSREKILTIRRTIEFFIVPLFVFSPWAFSYATHASYEFWQTTVPWLDWRDWIILLSNNRIHISEHTYVTILMFAVGLFLCVLFLKSKNFVERLLCVFVATTIIVYYCTSLHRYFSLPRYMIFVAPFVYLAFMSLVQQLEKVRFMAVFGLSLFFVLYIANINFFQPIEDWKYIVERISSDSKKSLVIVDTWYRVSALRYFNEDLPVGCILEFNQAYNHECSVSVNEVYGAERVYYIQANRVPGAEARVVKKDKLLLDKEAFISADLFLYEKIVRLEDMPALSEEERP